MKTGKIKVPLLVCTFLIVIFAVLPLISASSYSEVNIQTNAHLNYPSVYDGYLWIVESRSSNVLKQCDLASNNVIKSAAIPCLNVANTNEAFPAFVYNGLVFVPTIGYQTTNTVLTVFDESTLSVVAQVNEPFNVCNAFITAMYDPIHNLLLFGCDMQNGSIGIWAVDPSQASNSNAYYFINIGPADPQGGWEMQPALFNNRIYVSYMNDGAGFTQTVITRIFSSADLKTWTLENTTSGTNSGSGAYFPSITASDTYIAVGVISSANTGRTTYRFVYKSASSSWQSYDSGFAENSAEDHPLIMAISSNTFLWEISARGESFQPKVYDCDLSTGQVALLFTIPNLGYNDRQGGLDSTNGYYYFSNSELGPITSSEIIKISTPIIMPTPSPTPTATPTPTPKPTPTPTPTPSPSPSPTPRPPHHGH